MVSVGPNLGSIGLYIMYIHDKKMVGDRENGE